MKTTQLDKIIALCQDGRWKCQSQFWLISHSPHKRRSDIEKEGIWRFQDRPCTHGISGSRDYLMYSVEKARKVKDYDKVMRKLF